MPRLPRRWFRNGRPPEVRRYRPALECLEGRALPAVGFFQTNLVSDVAGVAALTDPNLRNPWGLVVNPTGDFWLANAASGTVTLYKGDVNGTPISPDSPVITVPPAAGQPLGQPSGQVQNTTSDFVVPGTGSPAFFIFAGLDGTVSAVTTSFYGGLSSQAQVVATTPGASYTGLALANNGAGNFLYAANGPAGRIDVFDRNFKPVTLAGNFTDPDLPADRSPFNVANINGTLYVTYENPQNEDVGGLIDKFDTNGHFLGRFADGANLNAPWAVALAPAGFAGIGGDLLVGNFGDGRISVYNPTSGASLGPLLGQNGQPLEIERLWGLAFGNGATAGDPARLYFASGLHDEKDGLFGSLRPMSANERLVGQLYNDLLKRPADPGGLGFWSGVLNQGISRAQVITAIEGTAEFRAVEVNGLYGQYLHRAADPSGLSFFTSALAAGATTEQVAAVLAGSPEYFMGRGGNSIDGFLNALYQDALSRTADAAGKGTFTAALQAGATPTQVAAVILASDEFKADRVADLYANLLHRAADISGLTFFVGALKQGARDEQVLAVIAASDEYFTKL